MSALPPTKVPHPHVEMRADLVGGSPVVRGSKVPVRRLWAWHRRGVSVDALLKRYPQLGPARILSALAFAYDNSELVEADLSRERAMMAEKAEARAMAGAPAVAPAEGVNEDELPGAMRQEGFPFLK